MVYFSVFPHLIRNDVRAGSLEEAHSISFHLKAIELKLRNPGYRIEMKNCKNSLVLIFSIFFNFSSQLTGGAGV
jgi:hypothetical protein